MPKVTKEKLSKRKEVETNARSNARGWCLTINEPTEADKPDCPKIGLDYGVFGKEKAPTTGQPHIQAYVYYAKRVRFTTVKRDFPRAHIEVARGSPQSNYDYCTKEGDFEEYGTLPEHSGAAGGRVEKARWSEALASAKAGKLDDIPDDMFTRYYKTYKAIAADYAPVPADAPSTTGVWIYGATGVGKSRYAREKYAPFYLKRPNKWWDGYQGEPNALIEDLDPSHKYLAHDLKIWSDRYGFRAESKGSHAVLRPEKVIVTSQYSIEQVFAGDEETISALRRRMKVLHMSPTGPIVDAFAGQSAMQD